jgi:hypothetical protein
LKTERCLGSLREENSLIYSSAAGIWIRCTRFFCDYSILGKPAGDCLEIGGAGVEAVVSRLISDRG